VSIINRSAFPLSRQLDEEAGEMVLHKIESMGVQVLTNCSPTAQLTRPVDDTPGAAEVFYGFQLQDGSIHEADLCVYAIGIKPRDELARTSDIECNAKGGVIVDDFLQTSVPDVYAIGECASWQNNSYGLIAPGSESHSFWYEGHLRFVLFSVEMADILSFNLTQTAAHAPRKMNSPDLSTKLK
jgi:nitrite reductase (NAD(P)H)